MKDGKWESPTENKTLLRARQPDKQAVCRKGPDQGAAFLEIKKKADKFFTKIEKRLSKWHRISYNTQLQA